LTVRRPVGFGTNDTQENALVKQYEAMFLIDPTFAADVTNAENEVRRIMERSGADLILMGKWDERKLAYPIKRRKRGCYVLAYFRADPSRIKEIERDCQLSEHVLRVLVTHAESIPPEHMERTLAEAPASAKPAPETDDDGDSRGETDVGPDDSTAAVALAGANRSDDASGDSDDAIDKE